MLRKNPNEIYEIPIISWKLWHFCCENEDHPGWLRCLRLAPMWTPRSWCPTRPGPTRPGPEEFRKKVWFSRGMLVQTSSNHDFREAKCVDFWRKIPALQNLWLLGWGGNAIIEGSMTAFPLFKHWWTIPKRGIFSSWQIPCTRKDQWIST